MGIGAPVISDALHAFVLAKRRECCSYERIHFYLFVSMFNAMECHGMLSTSNFRIFSCSH